MSGAPAKLIEIQTKTTYLSAAELIAHRHAEIESPRIGLKRTNVEGTSDEQEELQHAYANLRSQLSMRRIERHTGRAIAAWHEDQQAAEVLRKDGKFESFGFNRKGKLYLEYYETLFLLELNRLQLEYCQMIVSVEQAYLLLLGEAASEKYNNYLVYSALSRAGYIVVKHQAAVQDVATTSEKSEVSSSSEHCIWAILEASIAKKPVAECIKASAFYATTQARMTELRLQIMNQTQLDAQDISSREPFNFDTRKRRAQSEPTEEAATKRVCLTSAKTRKTQSLIDQLKSEPSYSRFKQIFDRFDIVQLQEDNYEVIENSSNLRTFNICFDLHLHNEGFKRSAPKAPTFNVVIVPTDEPLPTHQEMIKLMKRQQLSLLVISVSESKQIQAFLYYMS